MCTRVVCVCARIHPRRPLPGRNGCAVNDIIHHSTMTILKRLHDLEWNSGAKAGGTVSDEHLRVVHIRHILYGVTGINTVTMPQ